MKSEEVMHRRQACSRCRIQTGCEGISVELICLILEVWLCYDILVEGCYSAFFIGGYMKMVTVM